MPRWIFASTDLGCLVCLGLITRRGPMYVRRAMAASLETHLCGRRGAPIPWLVMAVEKLTHWQHPAPEAQAIVTAAMQRELETGLSARKWYRRGKTCSHLRACPTRKRLAATHRASWEYCPAFRPRGRRLVPASAVVAAPVALVGHRWRGRTAKMSPSLSWRLMCPGCICSTVATSVSTQAVSSVRGDCVGGRYSERCCRRKSCSQHSLSPIPAEGSR